MDKLTEEQKELYLHNDGNHCPFCHSYRITTTEQPEALDGCAWQNCQCSVCKKQWRDVYTLTEVEETEDDENDS